MLRSNGLEDGHLGFFSFGQHGYALPAQCIATVVSSYSVTLKPATRPEFAAQLITDDKSVPVVNLGRMPGLYTGENQPEPIAYVIVASQEVEFALPMDQPCKLAAAGKLALRPQTQDSHGLAGGIVENPFDSMLHLLINAEKLCLYLNLKPFAQKSGMSFAQRSGFDRLQPATEGPLLDFLLAEACGELIAFEAGNVQSIIVQPPLEKPARDENFYLGTGRHMGLTFPVVDAGCLLGLTPEPKLQSQGICLMTEGEQGSLALRVDRVVSKVRIAASALTQRTDGSPSSRRFTKALTRWQGSWMRVVDLPKLCAEPVIAGLSKVACQVNEQLNERIRASRQVAGQAKLNPDSVITFFAKQWGCISLKDVSQVMSLDSKLITRHHSQSDVALCIVEGVEVPLMDVGQLVFGEPLSEARWNYALVCGQSESPLAFAIESLGSIQPVQWATRVPRLGSNPAPGAGPVVEAVEIQTLGLVRKTGLSELRLLAASLEQRLAHSEKHPFKTVSNCQAVLN